jgi:hypothetical protein
MLPILRALVARWFAFYYRAKVSHTHALACALAALHTENRLGSPTRNPLLCVH